MNRTLDAELLLGALGAEVGAVVERLVAASADVEDDPDIHGIAGRRLGGAGGMDEEEGDVDDEERGHEEKQLPHDLEKSWRGGRGARLWARGFRVCVWWGESSELAGKA